MSRTDVAISREAPVPYSSLDAETKAVRDLFARPPLGFRAGDANLFRYVENDPINLVDPSGLEPPDPLGGEKPRTEAINVDNDLDFLDMLRRILGRMPTPSEMARGNQGCVGTCQLGLQSGDERPHLSSRCFKFSRFPTIEEIINLKDKVGKELGCKGGQVPRAFMVQFQGYRTKEELAKAGIKPPRDPVKLPGEWGEGLTITEIDPVTMEMTGRDGRGPNAFNFDFLLLYDFGKAPFWLHMNRGRGGPGAYIKRSNHSYAYDQSQGAFNEYVVCIKCGPPVAWYMKDQFGQYATCVPTKP